MKPYLITLFLLLCFNSFAQKEIQLSKHTLHYLDKNTNQFILIDDSAFIYVYDKDRWKKKTYYFLGETYTFKRFQEMFEPISVKGEGTYFVHKGGGVVFQLYNDTLQRVDNSFEHRSQYGFSMFDYNNTIHCFGGYGLFTSKNHTTYYDKKRKEWYEIYLKNDSIPDERSLALSYIEEDRFYVIGGYKSINEEIIQLTDVWELNLTTKRWKKKGELNDTLITKVGEKVMETHQLYGSAYALNHAILKLDVKNNRYQYFHNESYRNITCLSYNEKNKDYLVSSFNNKNRNFRVFTVEKERDLLKGRGKMVHNFYITQKSNTKEFIFVSSLSILCLIGIFFIIWKERKTKKNTQSTTVLTQVDNEYFTAVEMAVLQVLLVNKDGTLVSDLNPFFDEDNLSYTTLKKRREIFIKTLREKLTRFSNLSPDEVFTETKSEKDRRIKIISLHTALIIPIQQYLKEKGR